MDGSVITFYSYKGGVGRSFTLANIAILLARWGNRVLTIDWDVEAPGLHQYFAPLLTRPVEAGLVELVADFSAGAIEPADGYVTRLNTDDGVVDLIAAGRQDEGYAHRVQGIDWADLYAHGFADALERLRAEWVRDYDFVLIDSRTGWADIANICTAHLPDRLVLLFTANEQSVGGAVDVALRAGQARDRMPYDRPRLTVLPVLSRFDSRVEYQRAENWYQVCARTTKPLFSNWLNRHVSPDLMMRHLTLPYVSYWSFGEQLPVLAETTPSTDQIAYALETVAAIVAHRFDRTDLLADNRDAYVTAAHGQSRDFAVHVLVSSPRSAERVAAGIVDELTRLGIPAKRSLSGDIDFLGSARDIARHLCLVVDDAASRWQLAEAEGFVRRTLLADDRRLIPVLTPATTPTALPGFLRNIRRIEMGAHGRARDAARELATELGARATPAGAVSEQEALTGAVVTLARTRQAVLAYDSWFLVEQTLRALAKAVAEGGLSGIRPLADELAALTAVDARERGQPAPENVLSLVTEVARAISRREKKNSPPH